jgi:hypothetical protein
MSGTATPILGIQQVAANQDQKELTINDGFLALENAGNASLAVSLATLNAATLSVAQLQSAINFSVSGQVAAGVLTIPLQPRLFLVSNSGSYAVQVKGATGAAVTVNAGTVGLVLCDGTNCFTISATLASAAVANGSIMANLSGAAAAPTGTTVTAILDTVGAVEGSILYRSAAAWLALPPGTAGQMLKSGGAGAVPSWVSLPASAWHEDFVLSISDNPTPGANYWYLPVPETVQIPAGWAGSAAVCRVHGTSAATVFAVGYIRGGVTVPLGTITFGTSSVVPDLAGPTAAVTLLPGDILVASAPAVDSALADVGFIMIGIRQ